MDVQLIQFDDLTDKKINQTLNHLKKQLKLYIYNELIAYYEPMLDKPKVKTIQSHIKTIASRLSSHMTNTESGISQLLQLISKQMEIYHDITLDDDERDEAKSQIEFHIETINESVVQDINYYIDDVKSAINKHVFQFSKLMSIKGITFKELSHLYLAIVDNAPSDIPYLKVYLEYEMFLKAANDQQRLWLTYTEIEKPIKSLIIDGNTDDDNHTLRQKINHALQDILSDETFVKPIKASAFSVDEDAYASRQIYDKFYQLFEQLMMRTQRTKPLIQQDKDVAHLEAIIRQVEEENQFDFTIEQKQAIFAACQHSVFSLTGLAGTGKSTAVKAIIRIYEYYNYQDDAIFGTAFTGQATFNLRQSVDFNARQCSTMDNWLACNEFLPEDRLPVPKADDIKLYIIDEFSMVNLDLMNRCLKMLEDNEDVNILFVGDIGQLPSIDVGFAYDFTESGIGQQIELTQVVRQGEDSIIPKMANEVRSGKLPYTLVDEHYRKKNFRFFSRIGIEDMVNMASRSYLIYEDRHQQLENVQIIANTVNIVQNVNETVQALRYEHQRLQQNNYLYNDLTDEYFYVNDRVIIVKSLVKENDGEIKSIFNGAKGTITDIEMFDDMLMFDDDLSENRTIGDLASITIQFDDDDIGTLTFTHEEGITRYMQLAYATTINKSQGSTIRDVIMVLGTAAKLNTSELIYTAMTRTSNTLSLVSSANTIKHAVEHSCYSHARTIYQDVIKDINQAIRI